MKRRRPVRPRAALKVEAQRPVAQDTFLDAFRARGNVLRACEAAEVGRRTVYDWIEKDLAFKARFEEAREDAVDLLEDEARRRAVDGVKEPVYQNGKVVGHITRFSDRLLEQQLKAHRPERYRERMELTGKDGGPIRAQHEHVLKQARTTLLEKLNRLADRANAKPARGGRKGR